MKFTLRTEHIRAVLAIGIVTAIVFAALVRNEAQAMTALVSASGLAVGFYLGRQTASPEASTSPRRTRR